MEYNTCSWSPWFRSNIKEVENIQQKFTKIICQRANISFSSYEERIAKLKLESIKNRRKNNDVIFLYKIINGLVDIEISHLVHLSNCGGYNLRRNTRHIMQPLTKTYCRHNYFQ